MKFHKTLEKGQVNAWKDFYIPYNELKNTIKNNKKGFENEIYGALTKIDEFYLKVEGLILEEKSKIIKRVKKKIEDQKGNCTGKEDFKGGSDTHGNKRRCEDNPKTNVCDGEVLETVDIVSPEKGNGINSEKSIESAIEDIKVLNMTNVICQKGIEQVTVGSKKEIDKTNHENNGPIIESKSSENVEKRGRGKKGETKKLIHSFDDNSITAKQKHGNPGHNFGLLDIFRFKDKYSHRQRAKKITKLIEACESMKRFASLNYTGFRKSIKKYDKLHNENMTDVLMPIVKKSYFYRSKRVEHVTDELKSFYKIHFAGNDKRNAKRVFENIVKREKTSQVSSFFSGSFLSLSIFINYSIGFKQTDAFKDLFNGVNMILYGFLLFGLCMIMFKKYYIHFGFIFDFDITTQESIGTYFFIISTFALINNLTYYIYLEYASINPIFGFYFSLFLLVFPFDVFYRNSRYFFVYALSKMLATPLFTVQFRHFYIADCLQSFTYAYKVIYLYWNNESKSVLLFAICLMPSVIRILQCYKRCREEKNIKIHMLNALKYTVAILFASTCYIDNLYVNDFTCGCKFLFGALSSVYSLSWDMIRDWELKRKTRIFNVFLIVFIALFNCCGRFTWVLTHFKRNYEFAAAILEVHRRFLWTLLRVECEHLNNRDNLKAICGFTDKLSDMFYKEDDELESGVSEDEKIDEEVMI